MQDAGTTDAPPVRCDVLVVGGGIVGLAVARELTARRPGASVAVLEREPRLGAHQTGHSSGVVHAGIYYTPGSLRARLCVEGARELYAYCEERGIAFERSGKLIVAASEEELPRLDELERRGIANGVRGLRRLGAGEIAAIEPHARGLAALHSPATGVGRLRGGRPLLRRRRGRRRRRDRHRLRRRVAASRGRRGRGPPRDGHDHGRVRRRLRRGLVGPARRRLRRPGGAQDRAVSRRLPAPPARAASAGAGEHLPGARPRPAVPRRARDPGARRRRPARPLGAHGGRPRRLPPSPRLRPRPRRDPELARDLAARRAALALRPRRDRPRRQPARIRRRAAPLYPGADRRRRRRRARPGCAPRRSGATAPWSTTS